MAALRGACSSTERILVVSYSRAALRQTGDGHFSPVGGYDASSNMALILDVARFKVWRQRPTEAPRPVPIRPHAACGERGDSRSRGGCIVRPVPVLLGLGRPPLVPMRERVPRRHRLRCPQSLLTDDALHGPRAHARVDPGRGSIGRACCRWTRRRAGRAAFSSPARAAHGCRPYRSCGSASTSSDGRRWRTISACSRPTPRPSRPWSVPWRPP